MADKIYNNTSITLKEYEEYERKYGKPIIEDKPCHKVIGIIDLWEIACEAYQEDMLTSKKLKGTNECFWNYFTRGIKRLSEKGYGVLNADNSLHLEYYLNHLIKNNPKLIVDRSRGRL